ncbi:MAG: glycoside hydrolase family 3 protein [Lachnospiraceae bacterium]|nr:glycoside hydrolase family 3 protein [Lachnospiraceae bacterium]
MTLREKILKTFIVTIREINTHGGPKEFFEKYPVGGMYYSEGEPLLDENGLEMGTATTFEKLNECKKYSKKKLLVCADGARVRGQQVNLHVQNSLGGSGNLEDAYQFGRIQGMQMNDKGVDWVLGPSIDMCLDHLMYLTAISDDPEKIAQIYRQVVRGIQDQGVCSTVKHFPGLGTYFVNMHIGPGANNLPFDEWMKTYGYTYKQMFEEDVMCVMTTHVSLKSYDNEFTDGYYPIATYSHKLTTDLLKGELGFKGAVVTDALIMGGMATGDLVAETVQAFKAGADLLLWPPVEAAEKIEELILNGEIPMSRLDDALERIERMENFRNKALENKAYEEPDCKLVDEKILEIAKHGICQLRNDIGLLPLSAEKYKKVLIVDVTDEDKYSSELLKQELIARGMQAEVKRDIYDVPSRVCWQADIDKLQAEYDLVIFNVNAFFVAQWSVPHMLIWASHLFDKKKKLIVNYGSPFFAVDYFPEDPTFIEMNCSPSKETIKMLADGLFGETEFTGKSVLTK